MALGDIKFLRSGDSFAVPPTESFQMEANTTVALAGEPVQLGSARNYVVACADGAGVIGTDILVGITLSTSDQTASANGDVLVHKFMPGVVYIASAKSAAAVDTQAEYDALVGKRVLLDLTAGVYTVDTAAADSNNNAIVIETLDILAYPTKVAFSVRSSGTYNN